MKTSLFISNGMLFPHHDKDCLFAGCAVLRLDQTTTGNKRVARVRTARNRGYEVDAFARYSAASGNAQEIVIQSHAQIVIVGGGIMGVD